MLAEVVAQLPGLTGADGWLRAVPDPRDPFPAVHLQVVWLADGHIHLVTVSGCTVAAVPPGRVVPRLAGYRYTSLEQLVAGADDWVSDVWPPEDSA
jgi:hypothetical protein